MPNVPELRLVSQRLLGPGASDAAEIVGHLGAVQAQDYSGAKWGLGLRLRNATDSLIERDFNEGKLLRTHMLRPTWHLVHPADLRWMQSLTSARVHIVNGSRYRALDLDTKLFSRAHDLIASALAGGQHLTRAELGAVLRDHRIATEDQRLAYLLMYAELEALVCSGPRRGKQHTYALVEERVPPAPLVDRDEALARLAGRYFVSHGPATEHDFSWWSGLTMKEARAAIALAGDSLATLTADGRAWWLGHGVQPMRRRLPRVFLLSIYDEYTIAYKDRSVIGTAEDGARLVGMGAALTSVIVIDGRLAGTWKRRLSGDSVEVAVDPFRPLTAPELRELEKATARFGDFLGLAVRRVA